MDVKKKIQILRACSRKKGERCSSCPAFGQGSRNCMKNTMKDAADALEKLQAELEQVKAERDAAVKDMEALMWFSGEGCHICANEVIVHKEPYVRSECSREKGADCCPKWRGLKQED